MQGLIVKDLLNIKKQLLYYGVFIAIYLVLALTAGMSDFFGTMISVMCAVLPITAIAYDERAKWDRYALSMPVSRRDIVLSKYLLGLLFCTAAFIVNVAFLLFSGTDVAGGLIYKPLLFAATGLCFLSLLLPLIFRFGVERGRILMILLAFLPAAVIGTLPEIENDIFQGMFSGSSLSVIFFACILLFLASVSVSIWIYKRKEIR